MTPQVEMSLLQLAANAAANGAEMVKAAYKRHRLLATDAEVESRLAVCKGCEFFVEQSQRCIKCGCFLALKTALFPMVCPEDKWPKAVDSQPDFDNGQRI